MSALDVSSVPEEPASLGEKLLDRIVAFRPIREEEVETQRGRSVALVTRVLSVDEQGRSRDHGELPVFWVVVRDQILRQSTAQVPWVAGVLVRNGRAYRLRSLTDAQRQQISQVIAELAR